MPSDPHRWRVLAVVGVAFFMTILDVSIVNVALPSIGRALEFSRENLQWVVTAYAIAFGGFLMLGGRAADLLGRRRVFIVGVALFTIASLVCGLAQSEGTLIAARAVQGLGGAIISPAAISIVTTSFEEGAERNKALGIWGALGGSGAAVGVLAGGVLTKYLGWEWIFFVNVPVGAAVLALTTRIVHESRRETARRRYDPLGAVTVTAGLVLLVYALSKAPDVGWATARTILFFIAAAALLGVVLFANFFLLTLYVQNVLHYSALKTGITFVATAGTAVLSAGVAQAFATKFGPKPVMALGLSLMTGGMLWYSQIPVDGSYASDLLPGYIMVGVGIAFSFVPVQIAALAGVAEREAGLASGLINTSQQIGGGLGVAIASTIFTSHFNSLVREGKPMPVALTGGYQWAFWGLAAFGVLAIVAALVLIRQKELAEFPAVSPVGV